MLFRTTKSACTPTPSHSIPDGDIDFVYGNAKRAKPPGRSMDFVNPLKAPARPYCNQSKRKPFTFESSTNWTLCSVHEEDLYHSPGYELVRGTVITAGED
jgi:hypothetical protein